MTIIGIIQSQSNFKLLNVNYILNFTKNALHTLPQSIVKKLRRVKSNRLSTFPLLWVLCVSLSALHG